MMSSLETEQKPDTAFYSNCRTYFAFLQKEGKTDDGFEDEFFFTLPAISANA